MRECEIICILVSDIHLILDPRSSIHLQGYTPLHAAASAGHAHVAAFLLQLQSPSASSRASTVDCAGAAAAAAAAGGLLGADGAGAADGDTDREATTLQGNTALHLATLNGREGVILELVRAGSMVNAINNLLQVLSTLYSLVFSL